jgi:alpha-amylase/alpha-mannosidase (GH57 family)
LEEYANGTAQEPLQEIAYRPADELESEERLFALQFLFQANVDNLIFRFPRYRELWERVRAHHFRPEEALPFFSLQDLRDLQVLSQLAWFDEILLAGDADIQALVDKGEGFALEDQRNLRRKQQELLQKVVPAYRRAQERGQIEISTSPFYHPILPLLCDNYIATEAHPGVALPRRRFRHPEDARLQLERAQALHERLFARTAKGVWPSEGSVSQEVLELCASLGFRWTATDQRVLTNSTGVYFYRDGAGAMVNSDRLYTAHRFDTASGPVHMLFRDQELSDLIGFVYSRMDPDAAAADLVRRILQSVQPLAQNSRDVLFPIILDGENAWEYFPQNGRPFLRALYRLLSEEPRLECVTVSEALDRHRDAQPLPRLVPGSWINANFDIWIGSEEDNQAWDLLTETREVFAEQESTALAEQRALALEELLVAEGSDWCWWYGPEHSTANDPDFDSLYRTHLTNVYSALGQRPPDLLSQPIAHFRYDVVSTPPAVEIAPHIDGKVTSYFEWMGAGLYSPATRATTMQGQEPLLRELHFGRSGTSFFLRVDLFDHPGEWLERLHLRIGLRNRSRSLSVVVSFSRSGTPGEFQCRLSLDAERPPAEVPLGQAALQSVLEVQINLAALETFASAPFQFQATLWSENLPLESLPLAGWIAVPLPPKDAPEIE